MQFTICIMLVVLFCITMLHVVANLKQEVVVAHTENATFFANSTVNGTEQQPTNKWQPTKKTCNASIALKNDNCHFKQKPMCSSIETHWFFIFCGIFFNEYLYTISSRGVMANL